MGRPLPAEACRCRGRSRSGCQNQENPNAIALTNKFILLTSLNVKPILGNMMVQISDTEFTPQQVAWLRKEFAQRVATGFDRATMMWIIGGLTAIGILAFGVTWNEIGSVREEVKENRVRIVDLANGLTRIEAILEERLPRN